MQHGYLCYMLDENSSFWFDPDADASCRPELKFITFKGSALKEYRAPMLRMIFIHELCHAIVPYKIGDEPHSPQWFVALAKKQALAVKLNERTVAEILRLETAFYFAIQQQNKDEIARTKRLLEGCATLNEGDVVPGGL